MRVILASKSPRRKELLKQIFSDFEIIVKETDETLAHGIHPKEGVQLLAERKGRATLDYLKSEGESAEQLLVISSDTLVELDGEALGKPHDEKEAKDMLRRLSGRSHNVHTGVAVHKGDSCLSGVATTVVRFRSLSDGEIEEYVRGGEPMDKAGAYGIQGGAGKFVEGIDGDFDTVVGLSLRLTKTLVEKI